MKIGLLISNFFISLLCLGYGYYMGRTSIKNKACPPADMDTVIGFKKLQVPSKISLITEDSTIIVTSVDTVMINSLIHGKGK